MQIAHLGIGVGEDDPGLVRIGEALRVPAVHQLAPRSLARLGRVDHAVRLIRSEEPTSELQSLMRISYAVFCLTKHTLPEQTHLDDVLAPHDKDTDDHAQLLTPPDGAL